MFDHILLAYDGSSSAETAFDRAAALAREGHHALHVVAVASTVEVETHVGLDRQARRCRAMLEALRERAQRDQLELEIEVSEGAASEQIVNAADRLHADLLVIGHRRRGLMCRLAEASVAKRVIDHAHCPVMVAD